MTQHGQQTAGVETGAKSSPLFERNMVNPTSFLFGGRPTARKADKVWGNGTLEKANAVL